ncbi:HAMP domain-containing sensor histidine kinase [Pseudoduganella sp. LjRoot289]|uniref:sensor histidine kinase n=1 Tax=Pseudoduganella sp. LjRoot289 TaxID=3342314 RepID=UPI003ECCBAC9
MIHKQPPPAPVAMPEPPNFVLNGLYACHVQELGQVRQVIDELVEFAGERESDRQKAHQYASLVPQLREANEHLVMATFGAQDSQAAAEELNRRQTEFLSMLAHELRNPLQPVMLANDRIGKLSCYHPDLPMLHGIIGRQVRHLVHLVDDLLDASRVSSGKLHIEPQLQPLSDILASAMEISRHAFDSRRQELQFEQPPASLVVNGDRVRMAQVFSNLLLNASKYTHAEGCIRLGVRAAADKVEVTVTDNGAGIPLETQPHIFDLFTQGPHPPGLASAGLGIGLSLARTITELHGGTVRVHSAGSGSGSEFTVTLPLSAAA